MLRTSLFFYELFYFSPRGNIVHSADGETSVCEEGLLQLHGLPQPEEQIRWRGEEPTQTVCPKHFL